MIERGRALKIQSTQRGAITSIVMESTGTPEQWVFVTSDLHIDSVYCNRDVLIADLDEAKRRGAMILLVGDVFDAMQGRFDPRRNMADLRPEYRREDYYDFVVADVGRILAPFAENIAMISDGNHELSVLKNANTNLADRLVERLNNVHGGNVRHGGYGGWVRFVWERSGKGACTTMMKFFHGAGGEAPVTRGAIQTNRQAVYLPDADIVVNGHSHNAYWIPITRERITDFGTQHYDTQHHVRTPGYKQSYGDGTTGWDVTRGGVPKPLGGCWLRLSVARPNDCNRAMVEVIPAIHDPEPVNPVADVYSGVVFSEE